MEIGKFHTMQHLIILVLMHYSCFNYMNYEASTQSPNTGNIVSPAIDLSTAQIQAELSFWMHAFGSSMGTLDVGVGTSGTIFIRIYMDWSISAIRFHGKTWS